MTESATPPVYFLLVDDRDENLLALEAILRREQLVLLKATSGEQALEALLEYDIALALIDVQMPSMNGFELAELMRGTEKTRRIPIIFLTAGSADEQRRFRGYETGAVDFLHKPIEPDVLKSKADVFFELYRQRQEVARHRDELQVILEENSRLLDQARQYAEALQLADRRKDEFLATLAHELRNPLAPILSAVQVVRMGKLEQKDLVSLHDIIERQVHHMARLIDDLLDVSRITRGKIQLRRDRLSIADVIKTAIEASSPLISASHHTFHAALNAEPIFVEGDSVRLSQILANVLNNAAKYTPEGGKIELAVTSTESEVVISIKDNGIGIPEEMLDQVFEMFTQVNQHQQRSQGGLGIGLTLVKRLVEMHGGSITVTSPGTNQGAEFTIRLPRLAMSPVSQASSDANVTRTTERLRVLVIDDNSDAANCLAILLRLEGHDVTIAFDGQSGVQRFGSLRPNVVFLDLGMPGMDGYETARQIRQTPGGDQATVVAVTGWGQESERKKTQEAGFNYHLVKPVNLAALHQIFTAITARIEDAV